MTLRGPLDPQTCLLVTSFYGGTSSHVSSTVYQDKPRTLNELKESIRQQIIQINRHLLARVEANYFRNRLQQCVDANGRHMPDIIFAI